MAKILIVEDNRDELVMAVKIANEMGFEVVTATRSGAATSLVCQEVNGTFKPLVNGVVTDIFMPHFPVGDERHNADNPCGVLVALAAMAAGIPVVFCTSEYHHSDKGQWICSAEKYTGAKYIDAHTFGAPIEERPFKAWRQALTCLQHRMELKAKSATA